MNHVTIGCLEPERVPTLGLEMDLWRVRMGVYYEVIISEVSPEEPVHLLLAPGRAGAPDGYEATPQEDGTAKLASVLFADLFIGKGYTGMLQVWSGGEIIYGALYEVIGEVGVPEE